MMAFNLELIRYRAAEVRQNLALLRPLSGLSGAELGSDADRRDAALFRLLVSIEAAQAIASHLAARLATRPPDSMPDCFLTLGEAGVVTAGLSESLARMARFRNLLVHRYWNLDLEVVAEILRVHVWDLEEFLESVERFTGGA